MATSKSAKVVRVYASSDTDMLTTAATIITHAKDNKAALIAKRSSWKDPFSAILPLALMMHLLIL